MHSKKHIKVTFHSPQHVSILCFNDCALACESSCSFILTLYGCIIATQMTIAAIARRRKMLCDEVIIPLADTSWEILDISGSEVTDSGLIEVTKTCKFLRAVDIRYGSSDISNEAGKYSL